jgi:Protein of unknown function (DUF1571)
MARSNRSLLPLLGLTGALIVASGSQPVGRITSAGTAEPVLLSQPASTGSVDLLGQWIKAAAETFTRVRDYQCTFAKRERIEGALQDEQIAVMKIRSQPFSVNVKFTSPRSVAGKEASYVAGRHNGMIKAKSGGALGLVGYVTMDPRDPKALRGTRHSITEAGIGNLIERLCAAHAQELKRTVQVTVAEVSVNRRNCVRFDISNPGADGIDAQPRTLVYFDSDTNLPIRYEAYDRRGELVECFSYTDLHFNVGLTDAAFP